MIRLLTPEAIPGYTGDMTHEAPTGTAAERANTFAWPPVLLVLALIAGWMLGRYAPLPWPGLDDGPARIVGLGIGLAGLVLIVSAVITLWRHDTTVMPDQKSARLVTSGPYAMFRNPIYLGEVMATLGLAEVTKNIWFVAAAILFALLVTRLQILAEERHLEARFGEDYLAYKARTRRWI